MRFAMRMAARSWILPLPDASTRIATLLGAWSDEPAECAAMGARGRAHVLEHFAREANCKAIESIIGNQWKTQ